MGCWNETCGVTQLPIHSGDKIRAFILIDNVFEGNIEGGGTCYATGEWLPIGVSIQGEYDYYGGMENIVEHEFVPTMLETLKEGWLVKAEDASRWSIPTKPAQLKIADALNAIERSAARYNSFMGRDKSLGIMYVLEDVYQAMMHFNPIEAHFHHPGYDYKPVRTAFDEDVKEWYTESLNTYLASESDRTLFRLSLGSDNLFFDRGNFMIHHMKHAFMDLIEKKTPFEDPAIKPLCDFLWEMIHFNRMMMSARKIWHPQGGKSQDTDLAIYKKLQSAVDHIITTRDREYEEENVVEEPDENGYYQYMLEQNAKYLAEKNAKEVEVSTKKTG